MHPAGRLHYTNGPYAGFIARQIDIGFRTNSFSYTNGNVYAETNELGLVTTHLYDNLNRLVSTAFPDGTTISNVYDKLDLIATKDRLNHWTYYGYNQVRQLLAVTNVNGQVTTYDYCGCGAPDQIVRRNGTALLVTQMNHNIQSLITNVTYPDGYQLNYAYDAYDDPQSISDSGGHELDLHWTQHGLENLNDYATMAGQNMFVRTFDEYGRVTNNVDRNGVITDFAFDNLGRMTNRTIVDPTSVLPPSVESFAYTASGLSNYVDALSHSTTFVRDALGRVRYETNADTQLIQFTYNPSSEISTLTDGKGQTTKWNYDSYGRVTNKVDAADNVLFVYQYDALNRLTNRWSVAKTNTVFVYDPIGNLTNVVYLSGNTSNIVYSYDELNRLTNMVDAIGSTAFSWTDGNQLESETGPWADDQVSYAYDSARQRSAMSLLQPNASPWVQQYDYDSFMGLADVYSPAGTFTYNPATPAGDRVGSISMSGGNVIIENAFDGFARLTQTSLNTPFSTTSFQYGYDGNSQRTQEVFAVDGTGNDTYRNYTYDNIGQLKTTKGTDHVYDSGLGAYVDTPRLHEQFGYAYDAAWNLNERTNNALVQTFNVNNLNELTTATRSGTLTVAGTATEPQGGIYGSSSGVTSVTVSGTGLSSGGAQIYHDGSWARAGATLADGANSYTATATDTYGRTSTDSVSVDLPATSTFVYDLNGNLRTNNTRIFDYDDENQLIRVTEPGEWKTEFVYDGLMRMGKREEFTWNGNAWLRTNEVRYVYDRELAIQERNGDNVPLVTYTRGKDLSGTLQSVGGIGGLLARTDNGQMLVGSSTATAYYFSDADGNVSELVYTNGMAAARYNYDPFGRILTMSGALAAVNKYRFSTKEWNELTDLYYYGFRFYNPELQKWLNRDPIEERGGVNLYGYVANTPTVEIDLFGLYNPIRGPNGPVGPGSGLPDPSTYFPSITPPSGGAGCPCQSTPPSLLGPAAAGIWGFGIGRFGNKAAELRDMVDRAGAIKNYYLGSGPNSSQARIAANNLENDLAAENESLGDLSALRGFLGADAGTALEAAPAAGAAAMLGAAAIGCGIGTGISHIPVGNANVSGENVSGLLGAGLYDLWPDDFQIDPRWM